MTISLLSKEEREMSKQRRKIRGHYFDGVSFGFLVGTIGGALLFRGFGFYPVIIAVIFYFCIGFLETKSYNQIKDALGEKSE